MVGALAAAVLNVHSALCPPGRRTCALNWRLPAAAGAMMPSSGTHACRVSLGQTSGGWGVPRKSHALRSAAAGGGAGLALCDPRCVQSPNISSGLRADTLCVAAALAAERVTCRPRHGAAGRRGAAEEASLLPGGSVLLGGALRQGPTAGESGRRPPGPAGQPGRYEQWRGMSQTRAGVGSAHLSCRRRRRRALPPPRADPACCRLARRSALALPSG